MNEKWSKRMILDNSPSCFIIIYIFIPFGRFSSLNWNPGRPMMIWSAMKLPDGLRSFIGLRICGASSVCCGGTFRTLSASGLTSCPSFSFSATSGVGGASSNCILRSSAASSDFNCFNSYSLWHRYRRFTRLPDFGGKPSPLQGQVLFSWLLKTFWAAEKTSCCVHVNTKIRLWRIGQIPFKFRAEPPDLIEQWFKRWKTWIHENREIQILAKRIYRIAAKPDIEENKPMVVRQFGDTLIQWFHDVMLSLSKRPKLCFTTQLYRELLNKRIVK